MTEAIRIAHIVGPKGWRGGEQQAVYLYEELDKLGVFQVFICRKNSVTEQYCQKNGFRYKAFKLRFSMDPIFARNVAKVCSDEQITFMHPHDSATHTAAVISKDLFKNPAQIVLQRRVDFPVSDSRMSRYKYNHPAILKILCVSEAIRNILRRDVKDNSKLEVVYEGIDIDKFTKTPGNKLRTEFNLPADHPIIANVAALSQQKDYFTFTDTVEILLKKGVNASFLAIGEGPQREEILQYVKSKGLENKIIFTGFRTDIPEILPELDILLFSSETEGLGTTILDAFACGVPVVSTNAGGIPELISHLQTGYLANVKDAESLAMGVELALNDHEVRNNWITNARRKVEQHFTKAITAKATLEVYKKLVS